MPRKRKPKKKRPHLMAPAAGPPVNLRPGGAHKSEKDYDRKRAKAELRKELEE